MKIKKEAVYKIIIAVAVFWLLDFLMHFTGVGESNYYYFSKFMNSILFASIFFILFNYKSHFHKLLYSIAFGTWISFYYLISSYSGAAQKFFGIYALYSPPPFVIFGIYLTPIFWWFFHIFAFHIGLELAQYFIKK